MNELVRLGSNENLLGPSPVALEEINKICQNLHIYSVDEDLHLMHALAEHLGNGMSAEQFVVGNGGGDVLRMITQTYVLPGDEVIMPDPTFAAYQRLTGVHRGNLIRVPLVNYQIDVDGIIAAVTPRTKLIFICNPNNPTGQMMTHDQMRSFLSRLPDHVLVVVDEAYAHFATDPEFPNMVELVQANSNVIVMHTFSKLYGLASLRVGYGYGAERWVEPVRKTRHPSDSGRIGYMGAAAALKDTEHAQKTLEMVINGRQQLYEGLDKLGIEYLESQAFFVQTKNLPIPAQELVEAAAAEGVILRHTDVFNMPEHVRISVGRPEDNARALDVLSQILSSQIA
ncbi:MAG: histidinol-phosphate transaminase [Chloroflexota bacterium]